MQMLTWFLTVTGILGVWWTIAHISRKVMRKLVSCLESLDFVAYRLQLNLQSVHLRGLDEDFLNETIPGFEPGARL